MPRSLICCSEARHRQAMQVPTGINPLVWPICRVPDRVEYQPMQLQTKDITRFKQGAVVPRSQASNKTCKA